MSKPLKALYHLVASLVMLACATAVAAQDGAWKVSESKGAVTIIDSASERTATLGMIVPPGAAVQTGTKSSAVLVRGKEFVTLRQNSRVRIAPADRQRSIVQILQDYGSAMFNIGKQADPHFGVETPYLAAVVKGTTFIISVTDVAATLQVTEGAVEASTRDGGARELIRPGNIAMIAAGDNLRMVVEGETRRVIDSPARPAPPVSPEPPVGAENGQSGAAEPSAPETDTRAGYQSRGNSQAGAAAAEVADASYRTGTITAVIASAPADLRGYSGGFVAGEVAVAASLVAAESSARNTRSPAAVGNAGNGGSDVCYRGDCGLAPRGDTALPGYANTPSGSAEGAPGNSGNAPGNSGNAPSNSGNAPSGNSNAPGGSGNAPSGSGNAPSGNANAPSGNDSANTPRGGGNAPGGGGNARAIAGSPQGTTNNPRGNATNPSGQNENARGNGARPRVQAN